MESEENGLQELNIYSGISVSQGIAIGTSKVLVPELEDVEIIQKVEIDVDYEIERYEISVYTLKQEINNLITTVSTESKNVIEILESNILILSDPIINENIHTIISTKKRAEYAISKVYNKHIMNFKKSDSDFFKARIEEMEYIKKRLIYFLKHKLTELKIEPNTIIVAQNLTPGDIVRFFNLGVSGFITEVGGITSHVSIMARNYKIPSIIGIKNLTKLIKDKSNIILDSYKGIVISNPTERQLLEYNRKLKKVQQYQERLGELIDIEPKTIDGTRIEIHTNVDLRETLFKGNTPGATGIGLVRTETMVINRAKLPTLEDQFEWYKDLADKTYPNIVTIRAFDIGSDKFPEALPTKESNPALGCRGIRFLLHRKEIFHIQIKAILMASVNKNIRLMLPMVSNTDEVKETRAIIAQCMIELDEENIQYDKNLPLGIMIETPAAAITADIFAPLCDFFSIGSNDLTQYSLGVDRENDLISDLFDSMNPAVLRLIKKTVDSARKFGIPVGICGELAAYSNAIPILVGLGVRELSVSPAFVLETKKVILDIDIEKAEKEVCSIIICENIC